MTYLTLTPDTLPQQHICCAISDKKCRAGYDAKKQWLAQEYAQGYRFHRLDARGKVFIEYGPGAQAWLPVEASDWMIIGCFWVSGRFKKLGHAKALLDKAQEDAEINGLNGLAAVVGRKKFHFQSDGKYLIKQGFHEVDHTQSGFSLLVREGADVIQKTPRPRFTEAARSGRATTTTGVCVYYSNRCPFTQFHIDTSLRETCAKRDLPLSIHKINSLEDARTCPAPSTIFSLFLHGTFITTDLSVCMDSRFDKIIAKSG